MMYKKPKIEIMSFLDEDIITDSGGKMLPDGFWGEPDEGSFDWQQTGAEG